MRGTLNAIKITIYIAFSVLQKEAWQLCHDKQLKTMRLHLPFPLLRDNKMLFQMLIHTGRPYCIRNNYILYYTYAPPSPCGSSNQLSLLIAATISPFYSLPPLHHNIITRKCRVCVSLIIGPWPKQKWRHPKSRDPGQKASDNCRTDKIGQKEMLLCCVQRGAPDWKEARPKKTLIAAKPRQPVFNKPKWLINWLWMGEDIRFE